MRCFSHNGAINCAFSSPLLQLSRLSERNESHKDQATNTRNQSTSVDADLLGPCEPGTHVNLDGYVCLETLTGEFDERVIVLV